MHSAVCAIPPISHSLVHLSPCSVPAHTQGRVCAKSTSGSFGHGGGGAANRAAGKLCSGCVTFVTRCCCFCLGAASWVCAAAGDTVTECAYMDGEEERRHVGFAEAAPSSEGDGAHRAWAAQPINRVEASDRRLVRGCNHRGRQAGQPTNGHDDHSHSRTLSLHCLGPCQGPRTPQLLPDQLQWLPQPQQAADRLALHNAS